jgi:NADH-quinone oxidoreductase subunit K
MQNIHVGLNHFLFVSVILFGLGIYSVVTRKSIIMTIIGIELILSAANLNFISFQRFSPVNSDGQVFSIFIIIISIAQAVVLTGLIVNFYKHNHDDFEKSGKLKL